MNRADPPWSQPRDRNALIAGIAVVGILAHAWMRWVLGVPVLAQQVPLFLVLVAGGTPLVLALALKAARREFGSDLLAGISIVSAVLLGEYLAGALVVLMLSGGEALEAYAVGAGVVGAGRAGAPHAARWRTAGPRPA